MIKLSFFSEGVTDPIGITGGIDSQNFPAIRSVHFMEGVLSLFYTRSEQEKLKMTSVS